MTTKVKGSMVDDTTNLSSLGITDNSDQTVLTLGADESATFTGDVYISSGKGLRINDQDSIHFGSFSLGSSGGLIQGGTSTSLLFYSDGVLAQTLDASQNATFAGDVSVSDMVTVTSGDISTGEVNGIQLVNVGAGGSTWHLTAGLAGTNNSNFTIRNGVSDTDVMTATSAGAVTFAGNIAMASGNGIDFSASTNTAGMTSELLDDYEEGTWTPAVTGGLGVSSGEYTKVGRHVNLKGYLSNITDDIGGGIITITGLPFTSAAGATNGQTGSCMHGGILRTGYTTVVPYLSAPATTLNLYFSSADTTNTWVAAIHSDLENANEMFFSIAYST